MNFLPGRWQVVDFRFSRVGYAVWSVPTDPKLWKSTSYKSPALVIVQDISGDSCFFIHESLVEGLRDR